MFGAATIAAIALPMQLARLFPGHQILIVVIFIPAVIAPFVSGAIFGLIWHTNSNPVKGQSR